MGMFDHVTFKGKLPDGRVGVQDQTKEFGCNCLADGRLKLIAPGFGVIGGAYGSGAVFARPDDVREVQP